MSFDLRAAGTIVLARPRAVLSDSGIDQSHFTRVFARIVGSPPGAWRRNFGVGS
jgi:hypothetical protein